MSSAAVVICALRVNNMQFVKVAGLQKSIVLETNFPYTCSDKYFDIDML